MFFFFFGRSLFLRLFLRRWMFLRLNIVKFDERLRFFFLFKLGKYVIVFNDKV